MVFVFVQWQLRENLIDTQLDVVAGHAQIYFSNLEDALERQQEIQEVTETMTQSAAGEEYALIAGNGTYLAHSRAEKVGRSALEDFSFSVLQAMLARETTAIVDAQKGYLIGAYRTSLTSPLAVTVGSVTEKTAALNALTRSLLIQLFSAVLLISLAGGAAALFTLRPLIKLANYANDLSQGNLDLQFDDRKLKGELAVLSASLKRLASSVQTSIASLEKRVDERTAELERRSKLLQAVADVGKAVTSFRELSELLQQTAHLIHENFGYYHVGIFLLDDHKEYATLAASNSEGGRRMLERKHQLKVGETSIVGYVTKNAQARIALDVGKDAVFFDNPDLPETRSEMALPLVAGGQTLGALDVQSAEPEAFSEEDISTLQILAEQIAIAIQNANLFNEARKALDAARISYAEQSREAWSKILRNQPRIGFLATPPSTTQTQGERLASNLAKAIESGDIIYDSDGLTISVPVKVRGQVIGAIRMKKSEIADAWTQDEVNLALALADQLSGALESARLYREAQQLAARESLISDISTRISAVSQTDAILRETVQELGQNLSGASVTFHLLDSFLEPQKAQTRDKEKPASAWGGGKGAA